MTDRISGFIVALDEAIRDDDVEPTLAAIRQIKHVLKVEPVVADPGEWLAEQRVRHDLTIKVLAVLRPDIAKGTA